MRRISAVVAILLVSGFLPLAAAAGLCPNMRCCHSNPEATGTISASMACCSETNCDATSGHVDATHVQNVAPAQPPVAVPSMVMSAAAIPDCAFSSHRIDSSPPLTRERLATLSTFLI
ncbi:MAG TPA: hypothetical protein VKU62_08355 [Thermoanaerobaculia bacterium]|nr:hypothetical protein [Thermoanaerobaculia bacterium]